MEQERLGTGRATPCDFRAPHALYPSLAADPGVPDAPRSARTDGPTPGPEPLDTPGHLVDSSAAGLTLDAAAVRAGCSVKTLRRAIALSHLPHHRVRGRRGQAIIIQPADLDAWLLERETAPSAAVDMRGSDPHPPLSSHDLGVQDMPSEAGHEAGHEAGQSTALVPLAVVQEMIGRTMAPLLTRLGETERTLGAERERRRVAEERAAEADARTQLAEEHAARLAAALATLRDQEAHRRPWWRRWGR